jgi:hypothetical protein
MNNKKVFSKEQEQEIIARAEKGESVRSISQDLSGDKFGSEYQTYRSRIRRILKSRGLLKSDTFTKIAEDGGFKYPENWEFGWVKTKEGTVFIRKTEQDTSFEDMREEFLESVKKYAPNHKTFKRKELSDPHLLVIDIADLHIGKLAVDSETGDPYNTDVAISRAIEGVEGILNKAQGFDIEKILFVVGNDVLHVDSVANTTTGGTRQDTTGMWFENYKLARELYVRVIEMLLTVADVHIVHNPSNHDYVTGFMLADSLFSWYRKSENVTFDVTNAHRKYFMYGNNLIGTSHGDGAKMEELPLIMANEAKYMWAATDWRYIYLHHIHHKKQFQFMHGKDYHGVTVEYLRSPSGTDSWHHKNGYQHAPKAVEGFIHHKSFGQVARLTHLFK